MSDNVTRGKWPKNAALRLRLDIKNKYFTRKVAQCRNRSLRGAAESLLEAVKTVNSRLNCFGVSKSSTWSSRMDFPTNTFR